ncbi:hypothetical protein [Aliiroseovarius lamellibrachiae]|uniref:hypothetical protein n=1 Tax=Aliiroseovarius lamellibrachiae TaxID=1924933 RepID=UPI001BDF9379|nr:hypothetical protein [Aliiroseovarius lamellibrachiae]MBT2130136.1 hypothetical protein [Aliiroseovarius lamellibrachiae]
MKTTEYYIALASAIVLVWLQHKGKPWLIRTAIAGASGGVAYGIADEVAASVTWMGEGIAMVLVTGLAYLILDAMGALIADRAALKAFVLRAVGGK